VNLKWLIAGYLLTVVCVVTSLRAFIHVRIQRLSKRTGNSPIIIVCREQQLLVDAIAASVGVRVTCLSGNDRIDRDLWLAGWRTLLVDWDGPFTDIFDHLDNENVDVEKLSRFLHENQNPRLSELLALYEPKTS
jgi:hypothetical protein